MLRLLLMLLAVRGFAADCSKTSTGLHPLTAPFFRSYKGMPAGLYPGASDSRPAAHELAGQTEMQQVLPRDAGGAIDLSNGKVALLSIGLSNTTQEFSVFQKLAAQDPELSAQMVLVDGAQGGWSADRIVADPSTYFAGADQRLRAAGVSAAQVQAGWMKLADMNPTQPFPGDAQKLQGEMKAIVQMLRARYPNLRLLYVSSRIYAGYASTTLNPEPHAYQSGFAVKWLIEAQIQNDPDLSYTAARAPWMSWGPYLWADGTNPRADGLAWSCSDFQDDGTHPSAGGALKVAGMLLDFFKGDSTTRPWFTGPAPQPAPRPSLTSINNSASYVSAIGLASVASIFGTDLAGATVFASRIPLPYGLAGVSVTIGGAPAPLYAVSPIQINLIVPPEASGTDVVVTRDGVQSTPIAAQFSMFTEGLFSLDASGTGPAAARHADGALITARNPAHRGEKIALFATGKGVQNPLILIPQVLPIVRIGGEPADVGYFSAAPEIPGVDQINVTIPANAPIGDQAPVQIQIGGTISNQVTLAIAP